VRAGSCPQLTIEQLCRDASFPRAADAQRVDERQKAVEAIVCESGLRRRKAAREFYNTVTKPKRAKGGASDEGNG
jgi:predicted anti-sigma-YlaC factor YlaD